MDINTEQLLTVALQSSTMFSNHVSTDHLWRETQFVTQQFSWLHFRVHLKKFTSKPAGKQVM